MDTCLRKPLKSVLSKLTSSALLPARERLFCRMRYYSLRAVSIPKVRKSPLHRRKRLGVASRRSRLSPTHYLQCCRAGTTVIPSSAKSPSSSSRRRSSESWQNNAWQEVCRLRRRPKMRKSTAICLFLKTVSASAGRRRRLTVSRRQTGFGQCQQSLCGSDPYFPRDLPSAVPAIADRARIYCWRCRRPVDW